MRKKQSLLLIEERGDSNGHSVASIAAQELQARLISPDKRIEIEQVLKNGKSVVVPFEKLEYHKCREYYSVAVKHRVKFFGLVVSHGKSDKSFFLIDEHTQMGKNFFHATKTTDGSWITIVFDLIQSIKTRTALH